MGDRERSRVPAATRAFRAYLEARGHEPSRWWRAARELVEVLRETGPLAHGGLVAWVDACDELQVVRGAVLERGRGSEANPGWEAFWSWWVGERAHQQLYGRHPPGPGPKLRALICQAVDRPGRLRAVEQILSRTGPFRVPIGPTRGILVVAGEDGLSFRCLAYQEADAAVPAGADGPGDDLGSA
jgi:hypothetical protein